MDLFKHPGGYVCLWIWEQLIFYFHCDHNTYTLLCPALHHLSPTHTPDGHKQWSVLCHLWHLFKCHPLVADLCAKRSLLLSPFCTRLFLHAPAAWPMALFHLQRISTQKSGTQSLMCWPDVLTSSKDHSSPRASSCMVTHISKRKHSMYR